MLRKDNGVTFVKMINVSKTLEKENNMEKQKCMNCKEIYNRNELYWINDNYGIPWKKVCHNCYDEVEKDIRQNFYGRYLTNDELYGEEGTKGNKQEETRSYPCDSDVCPYSSGSCKENCGTGWGTK